ncbi:COG3518 Predicted component of the type VI protein secretion system [Burkholderiales bacterium]
MAKLGPGGVPPLFDRLVTPAEGVAPSRMDLPEVRASLQRSLEALVSSRSPKPIDRYLSDPLTTLDWGIPDFGSLSPSTEADRRLMSKVIERAIRIFEPRLQNAQVRAISPSGASGVIARFEIQASVNLHPLMEQLSFSVGVNRAQ